MMPRSVRLLALAGLLAAPLVALAGAQGDAIGRDALAEMLMSERERAEWSALGASAREAWLDAFWQRLDPTPGTRDNEMLQLMRRRAERAQRMFADEGGWRSDRARVLVVKGLPRELERRSPAPGVAPPEIIWTYGDATVPEVRFRLEGDRYLLDTEVELGPAALLASATEELELLLASGIAAAQGLTLADGASAPAATTGAGGEADGPSAPDAVAPEVRVWMEMVFGGVVREDFDLQARLDTFPSAEGTYTVLSFQLDGGALEYRSPDQGEPVVPVEGTPDGPAGTGQTEAAQTESEQTESEQAGAEQTEAQRRRAEAAAERAARAAGRETAREQDSPPGTDPVDPAQEPSALELDQLLAGNASRATLKIFGAYLQGEPGREDTVHAFIIPFTVPESETNPEAEPGTESGTEPGPAAAPEATVGAAPGGTEAADPAAADAAAASTGPTTLLRSAAVTLMPGTYRLAWGVIDLATGKAATRDDIVDIPAYGGSTLRLTRPLLVVPPHREANRPLTADEVVRGIRMGNLVFDSSISPVFPRDGIVEVVLMAAGWHSDPAQPGKPSFEVEYRLIGRDEEGARRVIARLPVQNVDFSVLGQQIPLRQVDRLEPGGDYQIEVRVRDLVSGQQAVAIAPLQIGEPTQPVESTGGQPQ